MVELIFEIAAMLTINKINRLPHGIIELELFIDSRVLNMVVRVSKFDGKFNAFEIMNFENSDVNFLEDRLEYPELARFVFSLNDINQFELPLIIT